MFHPAESSEQQVDTYEMFVKSPIYNIEDKIKEFYKDVRYPSTLQSRAPSVASSLRSEPTSAALSVRTRGGGQPRCVLQLSTTAADRDQLCVNQLKICTPPPTRLRSWWTRSRPRR